MAGTSKDYIKRMIERARELQLEDAFAPAEHISLGIDRKTTHDEVYASKRRVRITVALFALLLVVIAAMSLCLPYYGVDAMGLNGKIYAPSEVLAAYSLWFQINVAPLLDSSANRGAIVLIAQFNIEHPDVAYSLVMRRGAITLVVIACGFLLAVSGMLFQTTFKNPLATPSMLGVSDGVTLGCIVFALLGWTEASANMPLYLICVYGFGALAVVAVLLLSRVISGRRTYSIFDMLLLGTVICQLLGGVNSYISNFFMDTSTWQNFYNIQQAGDVLNHPETWIVVAAVFVCTALPVLVLSFRFNLLSFEDEQGRTSGVRTGALRALALTLGSIMQLAAIASIGQVAMLSLAVPFLVRFLMPSEFRFQFLGNFLMGALVLLACVAAQHFIAINSITMPVGTVISVLIIPFFVWVIALQPREKG